MRADSRSGIFTALTNMTISSLLSLFRKPSWRRQAWRWLLPVLLSLLFLSTLLWLPWQVQRMESNERQEQLIADTLWVEQTIRFQLSRHEENLKQIGSEIMSGHLSGERLYNRLATLVRTNRELNNITWLDQHGNALLSISGDKFKSGSLPIYSSLTAEQPPARRKPLYSPVIAPAGQAEPVMLDYHVPLFSEDKYAGRLVASYSLANILNEMVPWWFAQDNEINIRDRDDNVVVSRASGGPGRGVYTHRRALDLPGAGLALHTNSVKRAPDLLPNLLVGSVIALSIGLIWSLAALWRDINRRMAAEDALQQEVSFRTAMENSLMTGLRARDLQGRITYVNPAFCQMVGMRAEELIGKLPPMPYWAPEAMEEYQERFTRILAGTATPQFETIFQRPNGERFPVLVFESPLLDDTGKQTGWMGSILDVSDRKRAEDLNRQQQEKLQASARLASMGEIASTLAHELNQPLAAISSYATGALNMISSSSSALDRPELQDLRIALEKASTQAQRAGQIIRSVHAFVKKRELSREPVTIQELLGNVRPLIELQARPYFVSVHTSIAPNLPSVLADRVMLEQVLLNLTRNAIESMQDVPSHRRILRITARSDSGHSPRDVAVSVIDQGHGISDEVAERLFSPFFSTKAEGMGMGLNICRTAVEFHGGSLTYAINPQGGTIFRFSLPGLLQETHEKQVIDS